MLNQTIDLDRTFQALADKSRRAIVERLTLGSASVSELAQPLTMSLAAVVQHVQVPEACGVVKTEKVGRTRMCRIEPAAMTAAEQWITDRRRGWEARLDRLGDILNEVITTEEKPWPCPPLPTTRSSLNGPTTLRSLRSSGHGLIRSSRPAGSPVPLRHWVLATNSTSGSGAVRPIAVDLRLGSSHVRVRVPRHRPRAADRLHERNICRRVSNLGIRRHGPIPQPRSKNPPGLHRAGGVPRWPRHRGAKRRRNPFPSGLA